MEEGGTSSTTGVPDDLASVEREERSVRLGAGSVIKTSRAESGSRGKEDTTFVRGTERRPGRSADSSCSRAKTRSESSLKGLVIGAGAGSSNASKRASFVGFSFLFKPKVVFVAVRAFPVFLFADGGEGRSLVVIKRRLPLGGDGAERSIKVVVLSLCAVWLCTGVCAALRAAAARVVRGAKGGDDVWSAV